MFYTYILYSSKLGSFYKGETGNILDRLDRHNRGYEKATQFGVPWILLWKGEKATKSEAKLLERKLKNLSVQILSLPSTVHSRTTQGTLTSADSS